MCGLWRYGPVDVMDGYNQLRHGFISDIIPCRDADILCVVNFGHPYPDTVISISRCLECVHTHFTVGSRVMTLYQSSLQDPWSWHPATVLAGNLRVYALVEIDVAGQRVREVVSVARIRTTAARTPLEKRQAFVRRWVAMPHDGDLCDVTYRKEFWPLWNRTSGTMGGWFEGDHTWLIYYIPAHSEDMSIKSAECEHHLRCVKDLLDVSDRSLRHRMYMSVSSSLNELLLQSPDVAPVTPETSSASPITSIPPEILIRIFHNYLTADDNLRSRPVCRLWNHILTSPQVSSRVHIDCTDCGELRLATLLFKMVTSATRILRITANGSPVPLGALPTMLAAMGVKIPVIVLKRVGVAAEDILDVSHPNALCLSTAWNGVCGKLVLEEVGWKGDFIPEDLQLVDSLVSGVVGEGKTAAS